MKFLHRCIIVFLLFLPGVFFGDFASQTLAQDRIVLVGSGSSLPEALYLQWNLDYMQVNPSVQVRYLPLGTQDSLRQILAGVSDFGGGDEPIPDAKRKESHVPIVELPTAIVAVEIVYNLPGLTESLNLTGPVIADIFLTKITSWNDPEIARLNPKAKLPATKITVVHRSEGKGANYILSNYLAGVSPEFRTRIGKGLSPQWPIGMGMSRPEDILTLVKDTPGAIGYTEYGLAAGAGLPVARVRNAAGEFVNASERSVASAAGAASAPAISVPESLRASLANAPGKDTYPICSFTWLYIPLVSKDRIRGLQLVSYLKWVYGDGQALVAAHGAVPLPQVLRDRALAKVAQIH